MLRSAEWVAQNNLEEGNWFSFLLTEIEIEGRGYVTRIEDASDISLGSGSLVTGRFATRNASDRVCVTFADGTSLIGTAHHPIWSPDTGDWCGLGELRQGARVKTRDGFAVISNVERLCDSAPVYNIEVDSEHVYEVTELGILVHNALAWDCDKFLELRDKFLKNADNMTKQELDDYRAYAKTLKNDFRQYMDPEDVKKFDEIRPDDMIRDHLHHILQKLIKGELADEVLEVQKKLWHEYEIDPFVSADILIWAPNIAGQHGTKPMRKVLAELNAVISAGASKEQVVATLRKLGEQSAKANRSS